MAPVSTAQDGPPVAEVFATSGGGQGRMMTRAIRVRRAEPEDLDRIEGLLDANDLPSADVRAEPASFFVARSEGEFVGIGGLERHGSDGLLRSVAITASDRGRGYGTALCDELEDRARSDGVETLYLLTTTAAPFFRRRGYEDVDRDEAPPRIRETTEFAELCPASATCLRKRLRPGVDRSG